ncbi:GspH/FimT family pseudopilin [Thauera aromatica]|nr:GspH/FimT family pseudopilin [Thauera aromatica]
MNEAFRRYSPQRLRMAAFSLVELMVAIAVLGIIAAIAAPSMIDMIAKRRVVGALEETFSLLHLARSEAIKQSRQIRVTISGGAAAGWLVGLSQGTAPCTGADDCQIMEGGTAVTRMSAPANYPGVALGAGEESTSFVFDSRGLASGLGVSGATLDFTSEGGWTARIVINPIGRIRPCSPSASNSAGGYKPC